MPHDKLTPKQEAFVLAYLETGNASEAYRRAYNAKGMADNVIHVKASELLKNGKVAVRVSAVYKSVAEKAILDRAWVLERLMRNAQIAMGEKTVSLKMAVKDKGIVEGEVHDRDGSVANKALELLGKVPELALWVDRIEHGGVGDFRQMSKDELADFIRGETAALGIGHSALSGSGRERAARGKPN